MPVYTFELRDGDRRIEDGSGVNLPDHEHAFDYALDIAREAQTRSWCLDVYDGNGQRAFELPFARIDPTLDHLAPAMRKAVERTCDQSRSLKEAIASARSRCGNRGRSWRSRAAGRISPRKWAKGRSEGQAGRRA